MRILVVTQHFWPEDFHINQLAESLDHRGCGVDVLTGKPNYPQGKIFDGYKIFGNKFEKHNSINIFRVPLIPRGKNSKVRLAINYLSFIFFGCLFAPWQLRYKKYDVIFVYATSPILQALPALLLGWIKKTPVVIWVQDLWPESLSATGYVNNEFVLCAIDQVVRFIYRNASLLLVQSKAFINPIKRYDPNSPISYYPNSADFRFVMQSSVEYPYIEGLNEPFSLVFAGNIGTAQAVESILDAAKKLKDFRDIHFIMLGDGSRRNWMLQRAEEEGLTNLHLPGRFPIETMPALLGRASALLVTLADRPIFEVTVPSKIQAYMAIGRPIIAALNGEGARLINESGAGIAVPAENGQALAKAIISMYYTSEEHRNQMSVNGRTYYREHFDHDKLISELIGHFQRFAKDSK